MKLQSKYLFGLSLAFSLTGAVTLFAQDPNPPNPQPSGGWRKFDQSNRADAPPPADQDEQAPPPRYQQGPPRNQQGPPRYQQAPPRYQQAPSPGPSSLTVPAGTWITVRLNDPISSDHSQPGDSFTATLSQPIVANGRIVAHRGQMVSGVVSEAKKAGRVSGTSRLGLELTEIGIADGRQAQVKTRMMERRGDTSYGRDAVGIGATVATGAAIGAAVNGGVGAGVGAAAGVVASTVGVLLTRGRATEVYPEQPLTFRLEAPLTVDSTDEAFEPVSQEDYDQREMRRPPPPPQRYGGYPGYYGGYGYAGPYYYGGLFSPYYGYGFGPGFGFSYRYYGRGRR